MIKQNYTLIIVLLLILLSCKNEGKETIQNKNTNSIAKQVLLNIEGDNIWIRDTPRKGNVVMKLNEGDPCVILDTSKLDTIRGYIDYWYQIKHKDTIGWVFGSQTNIKSESSKKTQLFLKQNQEKLKCKNIDYKFINDDKDQYLLSLILFSGTTNIDTLHFQEKEIHAQKKEWSSFLKQDYNFDGICDFIIIDELTTSHGAMDYHLFLYNLETKQYVKETSLPSRHGGIEINANKKEVIIYCSYQDCEGSYKFINNKFQRVAGKFTLEP